MRQLPHIFLANNKYIGMILDTTSYWKAITYCLSSDVGIPTDLKGILQEKDVQFLAESAYADACRPGNPRDTSVEEIAKLYRSLM